MRLPGIPASPLGWRERVVWIWGRAPERAKGYLARTWLTARRTEYYVRIWTLAPLLLGLLWPWLGVLVAFVWLTAACCVVKHERGHQRGVPASGCVAGDTWCIMAEEPLVGCQDGSWRGKAKLFRHQAKGLGRYCAECKAVING